MSEYPCYDNWIKRKTNLVAQKIDLDPDEDLDEPQIIFSKKTHVHNGILYDGEVAIDYCDSDRDYDY